MSKQSYLLILFLVFSALGFAQKPNPALRLPVTPDMPEFAKKLYVDDANLNVFELDKAYAPWHETYLSLKAEMKKAGENASDDLKRQFEHYKQYYKYYTRWRRQAYLYLKPDGSLDFTIKTYKDAEPMPSGAEKSMPSNWSYLGPVATRLPEQDQPGQPLNSHQVNVYSMDVAPSNASILYCGSEAGVVNKTTDKGLTWTQVGADFFAGAGIEAIAIHPTNPDIVYVAEGNNVQTTTNGGTTWSTALSIGSFNCNDLKFKPDEPEVVLASGSTLQRRTAGNIWTNVLSMPTYDIAFKPNDPLIVYVLVKNAGLNLCEFWKSTDGGLTWSIRSTGWISGLTDGGGRLTVTPADNNRVYAVLLTGSGPRVMRSDDAGETWAVVASSSDNSLIGTCGSGALAMPTGQGYYDLSIVASHSNADHLIVATTSAFKSTDGGATYAPVGGYCGSIPIHADIQEMTAKGGDTWIATDGGMNLSTDFYTAGANHSARINTLRGTEFWGLDQGWNEDVIVGGRYHNGNTARREAYPAGDYLFIGGGEAPTGYINPGNPAMTYFSDIGGKILPAAINGNVGGFTVTKFPSEDIYSMFGGEQKWDPRYMYTYYLGNGNKFWKTTDNGISFTALFTHSNPDAKVRYIEVSRSNPDVIYCTVQIRNPSDDGELWKTTDGGANWTQCNNPGTLSAVERLESKITMSGSDANTLWWCFGTGPNGQKVFKSTDGGSTWSNRTTATLDNEHAVDILHQLGSNGIVYFISNGKVFYRDNTAPDWTAYSTGLPLNLYGNPGGIFAKLYYKGGKIRVAGGNGIWEADFFTPSTTTLVQPMTDHAVNDCTRDTIQLESYSVVNGAATYQWSLSPAPQWISNGNIRNPRIVLNATPGAYSATLTVTDANGVTNRTVNNFISNLPSGNVCAADTIPGKAITLDGSGDYALPSSNLNLNSNTVTLTAWVKRNGAQNDFAGIVFASGGNTNAGINIDATHQLRYHWNGDGWPFNSNLIVPNNEWAHVALVITPSNATLYLNGVGATNNAANAIEQFDTPLAIGSQTSFFGARDFKGQIDEVTIWNTALTQNQIRELMHLTPNPAAQPNLVAYYQFNELSGIAFDKVSTRHASLVNATRVVSTGPLGGGASNRQTITTGGAQVFTGTGVTLGFPAAGTYPDGEVVVTRLNIAADSIPPGFAYYSDNHYWVIDNYGTNQTFTALDSMRLGNILVPGVHAVSPTSYQLNRRTANAHLLPWTLLPGTSIGANGGAAGRITFGTASGITQFGQFLPVNVNTCPINLTVNGVPILDGTYNADQEITSLGTVPGSGNVTFQSETTLLQPNFSVTLGGVFTVLLLSCFP